MIKTEQNLHTMLGNNVTVYEEFHIKAQILT